MATKWFTGKPKPQYAATDEEAHMLLLRCLRMVEKNPDTVFGFDVETHAKKLPFKVGSRYPIDWMNDTITFWSIAFRTEGMPERWCLHGEHFHIFIPLLENKDTKLAIWNAKFDAHIARNCRVHLWSCTVYDVLVMAQLFDENYQGQLGLKESSERWLGSTMVKFGDLFAGVIGPDGKQVKEYQYPLADLPRNDIVDYASDDAFAHLELFLLLKDQLQKIPLTPEYCRDENDKWHMDPEATKKRTLWDIFVEVDVPYCETLWRMERRGINVDRDQLSARIPGIDAELLEIEKAINREAGKPVNINSPLQLQRLFFSPKEEGGMGLEPIKRSKKTNQPSCDEEVLTKLSEEHGIGIAKMIIRGRGIRKTKGTYIVSLVSMVDFFHDRRIHPSFKQYGARTGRLSATGPNCFDGKTEILTNRGWVPFPELEKSDLVAQWWENETVEFVRPSRHIVQDFDGHMVRVWNKHIDLQMTKDHRCPLISRKTSKMSVFPASEYPEDKHQPHGGRYDHGGRCDVWLTRFLVAVQADGSWKSSGTRLDFGFNKKRKSDRLKMILRKLGIPYHLNTKEERKHNKYRFSVRPHTYVSFAYDILGKEREFSSWVLHLPRATMDDFCEEVFFWDGHWEDKTKYSSSTKKNADLVQAVLTISGRRAKVREYHLSKQVNYQVDHTPRNYSLTTNVNRSEVKHVGEVYCVTVPSGFIIVRRNGKACVSGNSENFPRADTDEFCIREAFVAPPGKKLIVADYGQLEMRIMAHMSQDRRMLDAIDNKEDLHCRTVNLIYGFPYEEGVAAKKAKNPTEKQKDLKLLRQHSKSTGFGIIYGIGPPGLSKQLGIPFEEAKDLINMYLNKAYPGVGKYIKKVISTCATFRPTPVDIFSLGQGYFVTTLLGRRRRLPDIVHSNYQLRSQAERQAPNAIIQGTAADIVKCAMLNIEGSQRLNELRAYMVNQIHDELVIEVPEENAEEAEELVKDYMEHPFGPGTEALRVPLPVDINIGDNWAEAK